MSASRSCFNSLAIRVSGLPEPGHGSESKLPPKRYPPSGAGETVASGYLANAAVAALWNAGRIFLPSSVQPACWTRKIMMSWWAWSKHEFVL